MSKKICINDTTFYNKASSALLGWDPTWFGLEKNDFGNKLETKVEKFQEDHDIKIDGLVGPVTFTRLETHREACLIQGQTINCGFNRIKVNNVKISEDLYNKLPSNNYRAVPLSKPRKINKIVIHWDAALSSKSAFNILKKRGYSTHFCVDNDGTIFQLLNTNHIAWHVKESNNDSIGIDISNAYYLKYNKTYERRGFGPRPVINSTVNGRDLGPHLGYYPEQIRAAKELIKTLVQQYKIPLETPIEFVDNPEDVGGVMFHYHLNDGKIDTAGFPLELIIEEIREELNK